MPSVKLSPVGNDQVVTHAGAPASGWYWSVFAAGSSTPQATYTSAAGTVAQAAQITLNTDGVPDSPIWLPAGLAYKFVLYDSSGVSQRTIDNVVGINDTSVSIAQWLSSGVTPTYISASQFSLVGDQTSEFHVGRRLQFTVTAGTVYGVITASAYTTLTTVTVALDSGALDAGLSAANLSILRADHPALPKSATVLASMGAAASGANTDINSLAGLTSPLAPLYAGARSMLSGLGLSTAGSSATMTIAAGEAADSTNAALMILAASMSKTTSAWASGSGNGGLDTGSIANSTGYHFYLIGKADGTTDVLFSTSASAPTLPSGYVYKRRIGWGKTNGSAQWTAFVQDGDFFQWVAPPSDTSALLTTPTLRSITVPSGVRVMARLTFNLVNTAGALDVANHWDPSLGSAIPASYIGTTRAFVNTPVSQAVDSVVDVMTNTSAQIYNAASGGGYTSYALQTLGWFDRRGRDA